jgi:putative SOS response-associated peptidase YedK
MCGRFVQASSPELLVARFGVDEPAAARHEPSYNVAPRATVYAVRDRAGGDGDKFYEWQRRGSRKQPMFVHRRDGEPAAFAGLWAAWRDRGGGGFADPRRTAGACDGDNQKRADPDGEWLRSCAIVTANANNTVAPLHDRTPVVLEERDWDRWLDPGSGDVDALAHLMRPASDDLLVAYPVGTAVNSADNDGPELVERVELEPSLGL